MNCDSTGEEKYPRARCRRKARVKVIYVRKGGLPFETGRCWLHYLTLEERARHPDATFRILKAEVIP